MEPHELDSTPRASSFQVHAGPASPNPPFGDRNEPSEVTGTGAFTATGGALRLVAYTQSNRQIDIQGGNLSSLKFSSCSTDTHLARLNGSSMTLRHCASVSQTYMELAGSVAGEQKVPRV